MRTDKVKRTVKGYKAIVTVADTEAEEIKKICLYMPRVRREDVEAEAVKMLKAGYPSYKLVKVDEKQPYYRVYEMGIYEFMTGATCIFDSEQTQTQTQA